MTEDLEVGAADGDPTDETNQHPALTPDFARHGLEHMDAFAQSMHNLEEALLDIESFGGQEAAKKADQLIHSVHEFEPSITMIGQIKSGKTSLVNAMAGRPDLLPADVNPWTSVVTSLHLNNVRKADDTVASFRFFDQGEWDFLVENGGRIGELSSRAGAVDELVKVREQIAEMREKTKARLGKKFELLLGQTHNYRHLDDELMQRYVCMGDDFGDPALLDAQGQFADITKSADLYLDAPSIPMPLCIRDTPGVNDTFMMREQITINALRGSRICVVVLSATQALSSMDMGLIRLISNVDAREVVVFVNRIDELPNPAEQIDEIRASILSTLKDHNGPSGLKLVFGSAYWANMALQETIDDLVPDSKASMENYAKAKLGEGADITPADVWNMSGLPALFDEISQRVSKGEGAQVITGLRKRALNHLHGLKASSNVVSMRIDNQNLKMMEPAVLAERLDAIEDRNMAALNNSLTPLFEAYVTRIDQAHARFLDRALESLLQHLENHGDKELWQYSPEGLRMLLRSSYHSMCKKTANTCTTALNAAARDLSRTYVDLLSIEVEGFSVSPPDAPSFPPPVSLGQTIALDLQSSWWKGWWQRRKGYRAYADGFYKLIEAETAPILNDMKQVQVEEIRRIAMSQMQDFLLEQGGILTDVSNKSQISVGELKGLFGITAQEERDAIFEVLLDEFSTDVEDPEGPEPDAGPVRPSRPQPTRSYNKGEAA